MTTDGKMIPPELVEKHYMVMVKVMAITAHVKQIPLEKVVANTVKMFGLVPIANDDRKYEMTPELKAITDAALKGLPDKGLPSVFTEDEAVLFCACQLAALEIEGKLGELTEKIKEENDRLKADLGKDTAQTSRTRLPKPDTFGDGSDGGPTFH